MSNVVRRPQLVVLAAGAGTRFGGLKQIAPVGPNGESIIDYTVADAVEAGVESVVIVLRREIEAEFHRERGRRYARIAELTYVHQDVLDLPSGSPAVSRQKPWGTAHAVWSARHAVDSPFVVANGDDFYGRASIAEAVRFLTKSSDYALVGYPVRETLSPRGGVSRALCAVNGDATLRGVQEFRGIAEIDGVIESTEPSRRFVGSELVSMNLWALQPEFFDVLDRGFARFLEEHGQHPTAEYYLPYAVEGEVAAGRVRVHVLPAHDRWFGITHPEDQQLASAELKKFSAALSAESMARRDTRAALEAFEIAGTLDDLRPHGTGHIHETFAAIYQQPSGRRRFILQRFNDHVFKDPERTIDNIARVTDHVRRSLESRGETDVDRGVLRLVPTRSGALIHRDDDGVWWRMYDFVERSFALERPRTEEQATEAAKTFARFQSLLADYDGSRLFDTIPNFHHTPARFSALVEAIDRDPLSRAAASSAEIDLALAGRDLPDSLLSLHRAGLLPERITHNDTKINNVLFDDFTELGICVTDLDTVMAGLALYDFGDLVRTAVSTAPEDEPDPARVLVRPEMFLALARGWIAGAGATLSQIERERLVLASRLLTYECGVRFLTDHLLGDTYFKIHRPGHNLDRARSQLTLERSLARHEEKLQRAVAGLQEEP